MLKMKNIAVKKKKTRQKFKVGDLVFHVHHNMEKNIYYHTIAMVVGYFKKEVKIKWLCLPKNDVYGVETGFYFPEDLLKKATLCQINQNSK